MKEFTGRCGWKYVQCWLVILRNGGKGG